MLSEISDRLSGVIEDLQKAPDLGTLVEAEVSSCVRRVLNALGWEADNLKEVKPEYSVGGRRVDYALLTGGTPQVFVEVKRGGEQLDKHQEQLLDYAFKEGIRLAILTNGTRWWFYLPLQPGNWEGRHFAAFCLDEQDKAEIVRVLAAVLGKENVDDKSAFDNAERLYRQSQRQSQVSETMPKAWNKLIDEFDGLIVARIAEMTGEMCGHEPDETEVEAFLSTHLQNIRIRPMAGPPMDAIVDAKPPDSMNGKKIRAFTFNGERKEVKNWVRYYIAFCEMLYQIDKDQFEKILAIRGRGGRIYFSKRSNDFRRPPVLISRSGIYACRDLSPNSIHRLVGVIADHLGYAKPTVEIGDDT